MKKPTATLALCALAVLGGRVSSRAEPHLGEAALLPLRPNLGEAALLPLRPNLGEAALLPLHPPSTPPAETYINDHKYVVVTPSDWTALTNRIALLEATASRRLAEDYKTLKGREIWHGAATNRTVNADGLSVTWLYADGFQYTERETPANARRRTTPPAARKRPSDASTPVGRMNLPPRLNAAQNARKPRKKPRTVNATFAPGGKVIDVKEVKQ